MYKQLKVCIIGNGTHSKRIQKILKIYKLNFYIYKPDSKKNYRKKSLEHLKKFNVFFIISPNHTHYHYIKSLYKEGYIFCEKPPTNNRIELNRLQRINSKKIYYNFNFRFSKISQILKNRNKYNLGNLIYANIISGKGLAFKSEYKKNRRSNAKVCPKGVFEMVTIHWLDLIFHLFNVTKIHKPQLTNLSKVGTSYDNSNIRLEIDKKVMAEIFCTYTSPLLNKKIFIFENGIVEQNENDISIKGPAINYDKNKFFKPPKTIKKISISGKKDYQESLSKSIKFFLDITSKKKNFSTKENAQSLTVNKMII
tara:strand:- start:1791 stop:2720 length:930 start_codon:yes stop_codon:yes gene_type:complete